MAISKVGDVDSMFGSNFNIVTTNASGLDIINANSEDSDSQFIPSSLIVASPIDDKNYDLGCPSLLVTDANGRAMRLTYTIKPGNGLVLGYTSTVDGIQDHPDVLSLAIDNDTLTTKVEKNGTLIDTGYLYVSAKGITQYSQYLDVSGINNIEVDIDELSDENRIRVIEQAAPDGSAQKIKRLSVDAAKLVDGITLKTNKTTTQGLQNGFADQQISVNLTNIVDNKTITTILVNSTRKLAVDSGFLTPATSTSYGVVKIDNSTIKSNQGRIYVDTTNLKTITNKGGIGIVKLQAAGKSDLYVDSSGFVRTDPKYMPKCGEVDKSKTSSGWGVCAVDGKTIKASHDGVLSVVSSGLKQATTSSLGVVRTDNTTIIVNSAGVISVKSSGLPQGSASALGLVKYDNSTITKNTQGQLTVTNATKWETAISDLSTRLSTLAEQIAAIRSEMNNTLTKIVAKTTVPFNLKLTSGKDLQSMLVHIPNVSDYRYGNHDWDTADKSGTFILEYGAGYTFQCRISSASNSSWMQSCAIVVNGQKYGMNSDIKLTSNSATCSLCFTIVGYGASKTQRPQGSWTLEFRDNVGNPLKSINIYIHSCYTLVNTANFSVSLNGTSTSSITATTGVTVNSTRISQLITKAPTLSNVSLINKNLTVGGVTLSSYKK